MGEHQGAVDVPVDDRGAGVDADGQGDDVAEGVAGLAALDLDGIEEVGRADVGAVAADTVLVRVLLLGGGSGRDDGAGGEREQGLVGAGAGSAGGADDRAGLFGVAARVHAELQAAEVQPPEVVLVLDPLVARAPGGPVGLADAATVTAAVLARPGGVQGPVEELDAGLLAVVDPLDEVEEAAVLLVGGGLLELDVPAVLAEVVAVVLGGAALLARAALVLRGGLRPGAEAGALGQGQATVDGVDGVVSQGETSEDAVVGVDETDLGVGQTGGRRRRRGCAWRRLPGRRWRSTAWPRGSTA